MARRRPLRRRQAPAADLIDVKVKWPRTRLTHPPSPDCDEPGHSTANREELLDRYRSHRQRLADALRPS